MCTVSFIARGDVYLLGMNRDELLARGPGLPLARHEQARGNAFYPTDGDGGTWIAVHESGIALAVLNWNDIAQPALGDGRLSRGSLIPALIGSRSLAEVDGWLARTELQTMLPFRMVGIFPAMKEIAEWRWDAVQMTRVHHEWRTRHWFSSGISDWQAGLLREPLCEQARTQAGAGSLEWLRRLHASHGAAAGAFSICVHRPDAQTMSYSEIQCAPGTIRMRHSIGSPCTQPAWDELRLERAGTHCRPNP